MQVISFEKWQEEQRLLVQEAIDNGKEIKVRCKECRGLGFTTCHCCDAEDFCDTCGGEGKVIADQASDVDVNKNDYVAEVIAELRKLAGWNPQRFDFFNLCCGFFSQQAKD